MQTRAQTLDHLMRGAFALRYLSRAQGHVDVLQCQVSTPGTQYKVALCCFQVGRHAMMDAGAAIPEWLSLILMSALWLVGGSPSR
jgi:hypothetical protein